MKTNIREKKVLSEHSVTVSQYKTELDSNNVIAFVPKGNSMWPTLKHNAQSVIIERKTERLSRLDVAFYLRADGSAVLHRVLEVKDDGYVMCGDSQLVLEPVKEEQVFGKMAGFYRKDKYIKATDEKYIKQVEKYYERKLLRKIRIKFFHLGLRVKSLFK